ncbi:MAG: hypothetical protein IJY57_00210 [Clostridia bacterium]|nr:hypothetical protein [Clostridia bacterium]
MVNYLYDCYQVLSKVYGEKAFLKQAINSTFLEPKNKALTIKTCYGVLDKEEELSYTISYFAPKSPKLAIRTILKIAMYAIKYLEKQGYAITKNAVELTKKLGKGGASGFVNAFLRKFINEKVKLPTNEIKRLSVEYCFPEFAVKELVDFYGKEKTISILSSKNEMSCLSFYDVNGEEYLKDKGIEFVKTPFENVYFVKNFVRNEDYDKGVYTFQSIGSVAICSVVDGGEKLLDCCSAPGGKSIRLSKKFNKVFSWDIHPHRVDLIKDYKERMGIKNICESVNDASIFNHEYEGYFDAVLCDAPCSGLGVVGDNPDIKLNRTLDSVLELNKLQISILNTVSKYVKVGGYLYYSTCSILNRENKAIIDLFMCDKTNYKLIDITCELAHFKVDKTLQFLPDESCGAGFYVAKLKRVK